MFYLTESNTELSWTCLSKWHYVRHVYQMLFQVNLLTKYSFFWVFRTWHQNCSSWNLHCCCIWEIDLLHINKLKSIHYLRRKLNSFIRVSIIHNSHGASLCPHLFKIKNVSINSSLSLIYKLTLPCNRIMTQPCNYFTKPPHPPLSSLPPLLPISANCPWKVLLYPAGEKAE